MRQSNGKYYVRFVVDGVEYNEPTGLAATERNRKKAERMEAAARELVLTGKAHLLRITSTPFSDAASAFLAWAEGEYPRKDGELSGTFKRIRSSFSYIKVFFGKAIVNSITEGHLDDFKSARRKMGVKEVSIRNDLHALSLFFQYCVRKHWCRENLVRKIDMPSSKDAVRMNILSPATERLYFETIGYLDRAAKFRPSPDQNTYADLRDFAILMLQQGFRPEELVAMEKSDVDLIHRHARVRTSKTRAGRRRLKLTLESVQVMKHRLTVPGRFLFPSPKTTDHHRSIHWRSHDEVIEAMKGRPGAAEFVMYDFRHTFATRAALDGMTLPVLAATLGHAEGDLKSVAKYVHVKSDDLDAEADRIEELRVRRSKSFAGFLPGTGAEDGEQEGKIVKSRGTAE
ncbi:MAG TPA: tyrosine-type recombinase/integrase [Bryobacteraceae bacterium]|jgi:site-specific recombinase XerD